ncbi:nitrous oxide reductase family maturation protein NosD [bacterium]|nr:nitrous oxide reductase family maturation protein NosD [bacterium]
MRILLFLLLTIFLLGADGEMAREHDAIVLPDETRLDADAITLPVPARPARCRDVPAGSDLAAAIADSAPGDALCLSPGVYAGPIDVNRTISIWGPRDAVVTMRGTGSTVRLSADGAKLLGFTVDGSGGRYDLQDAAVLVHANDAVVDGLEIRNALFGLIVEKSNRVRIINNRVRGTDEAQLGLRGDAVRVWETRDSFIENNVITHSRDMVIWYSARNLIRGNTVTGGRYGTHFMYSHGNRIEGNRYVGNVVGIFLMYSRDIMLTHNVLADSAGAAGIGLGMKESGNLTCVNNVFAHNTVGVYMDNSPYVVGDRNVFRDNVLRLSNTAIVFHASPANNRFERNSLRDNHEQVRVDGGGNARNVVFLENDYDDYAGYDLDRDGFGDISYEQRRLSTTMISLHPNLAFFRGSLALSMLDAASRVLPLYNPETTFTDPRPRMKALALPVELADAR